MTKPNHNTLDILAGRVNGAGSLLTAIHMGLIEMTHENIGAVIATLRGTADQLEEMTKESGKHD